MGKYNLPIRHGDVILRPLDVESTAGDSEKLGEYTAAYGEATGHHHTFYPINKGALLTLFKNGEQKVIKIDEPWVLRHQEHKEIKVPAGIYEIGIEREYDPFKKIMQKVID